jgi:hypothetical protein
VKGVLDGYIRDASRRLEFTRFQSLEAVIGYKAGRYAEAREELRMIDGQLTTDAQHSARQQMVAGRIDAFGGPHSADIVRAEELYWKGHLDDAAVLFQAARAEASTQGRAYLDQRLAVIALERELNAGKRVAFLPSLSLVGWTQKVGDWKVESDDSLVGTSGLNGLLLNCDARVGPDFDVEADIDIVSTSNGQFQAGITFGRPDFWTYDWGSFRIKRTAHEGEVAYFSQHLYQGQPSHLTIPEHNHVRVRSWKGTFTAWVNGAVAVAEYKPDWMLSRKSTSQVGFGAFLDDNTYVVRYRNATLRRLTTPPAPGS